MQFVQRHYTRNQLDGIKASLKQKYLPATTYRRIKDLGINIIPKTKRAERCKQRAISVYTTNIFLSPPVGLNKRNAMHFDNLIVLSEAQLPVLQTSKDDLITGTPILVRITDHLMTPHKSPSATHGVSNWICDNYESDVKYCALKFKVNTPFN